MKPIIAIAAAIAMASALTACSQNASTATSETDSSAPAAALDAPAETTESEEMTNDEKRELMIPYFDGMGEFRDVLLPGIDEALEAARVGDVETAERLYAQIKTAADDWASYPLPSDAKDVADNDVKIRHGFTEAFRYFAEASKAKAQDDYETANKWIEEASANVDYATAALDKSSGLLEEYTDRVLGSESSSKE